MELILLTIILILLFANLCVALMKNNRRQTEQLERPKSALQVSVGQV